MKKLQGYWHHLLLTVHGRPLHNHAYHPVQPALLGSESPFPGEDPKGGQAGHGRERSEGRRRCKDGLHQGVYQGDAQVGRKLRS